MSESFECKRTKIDGSLALRDVDYICVASDGWPMFAVATDRHGITDVEQSGGP